MQMPPAWAKHLEDKGASALAVLWLACVDDMCATYWKHWDPLIETFQNTVQSKRPQPGARAEISHDTSLLSECMQLHSVLHGSIASQFGAFRTQALQLAARMGTGQETPFGKVLRETLSDPDVWCERLATPNVGALRSAQKSLEGLKPDSAALAARAPKALPAAAAALSGAERQVRGLVTQCCVQPVQAMLGGYPEAREWTLVPEQPDMLPMALRGGGGP